MMGFGGLDISGKRHNTNKNNVTCRVEIFDIERNWVFERKTYIMKIKDDTGFQFSW
jgi:hypothetical protein